MKNFNATATAPQGNVVHPAFRQNFFARVITGFKAWRKRRIAIKELSAMPDYLLRDLGIERHAIVDAVNRRGVHAAVAPRNTESAKPASLPRAA